MESYIFRMVDKYGLQFKVTTTIDTKTESPFLEALEPDIEL